MNQLLGSFNPTTGEFAKNIRDIVGLDDTELRESLKAWGWHKELPALIDEHGVVLVGNRRMALAKELGITPATKTMTFGKGDEADAERLKLAIASNIGGKPLTRADRKRIAEVLYGRKWSLERIGQALGVSHMTASRDLADFNTALKSNHEKTADNPKGSGRPKGSRKASPAHKPPDEQANDEKAAAEPEISRDDLTAPQQKKFDIAARQHQKKLDLEFRQTVLDEIKKRMDEIVLPHFKERLDDAEKLLKRRKGVMSAETFKLILSSLHPDSRKSISDARLNQAFRAFNEVKLLLLSEKEDPRTDSIPPVPRNYAEAMALKEKVAARRRAARAATGGVATR